MRVRRLVWWWCLVAAIVLTANSVRCSMNNIGYDHHHHHAHPNWKSNYGHDLLHRYNNDPLSSKKQLIGGVPIKPDSCDGEFCSPILQNCVGTSCFCLPALIAYGFCVGDCCT